MKAIAKVFHSLQTFPSNMTNKSYILIHSWTSWRTLSRFITSISWPLSTKRAASLLDRRINYGYDHEELTRYTRSSRRNNWTKRSLLQLLSTNSPVLFQKVISSLIFLGKLRGPLITVQCHLCLGIMESKFRSPTLVTYTMHTPMQGSARYAKNYYEFQRVERLNQLKKQIYSIIGRVRKYHLWRP